MKSCFTATCIAYLILPVVLTAAPPRYDHVVIVVEENRTPGQIIGDLANAPYLTSLANGGVSLRSMFALVHPSQPNYLELFSGGNQGVADDNLPPNFSTTPTTSYPFRTANLGAELIAAGFTFGGFSEEIESAGAVDWADYDPHSATHPGIYYRRKHNPWANWVAKVLPVPANQMANTVNRAFTQFPADFSQLPTVSFVIPNQLHDMHDGSRKMADDWLAANLSAYAVWARTNNSLLIITWDEDDYNEDNQIPTIFHGANVRNGTIAAGTWTLHNLLRTIEDMYGLSTHAGAAAQTRSIVGPFVTDPVVNIATFRQGLNGYVDARDTQLWQETPDTGYATMQDLTADLDTGAATGNQVGQVLARFNNLFGSGANQVPTNATIHSAKLLLYTAKNITGVDNDSNDTFRLHRMLVDWMDTTTWNSAFNGISTDNIEAAATASFSAVPDVDGGPTIFDVTADVELFKSGTPNRGWLVRPSTSGTGDGWTMKSSEYISDLALRPTLEIVYSVPASSGPYAIWAAAHGLAGSNSGLNADPDHDGADNLAEFAYNLEPLVADSAAVTSSGTNGLPAASYLSNSSGGVLEVQFIRRKGPTAVGLSYAIQFSGDLATWAPGLAPVVTDLTPEWERVTVRDSAIGPLQSRFARVILTLQQ
jgi:acid phosphatase